MIRLSDRDKFRDVENEWQWEFVYYVLTNLGIPEDLIDECFPETLDEITPEHKTSLRELLYQFDVSIIDDKDGGIKIYVAEPSKEDAPPTYILVAEWKKCKFVFKEDLSEIDPNYRIYVEIHADVWTIFDDPGED